MPDGSKAILEAVQSAWLPLRRAAGGLGEDRLDATTTVGWTVKEMLAHVAFWDEAVVGVVLGMFRGEPLPDGWRFGSGYLPDDREGWAPTDVHNVREAAWARQRAASEVLDRLDHAHEQLLTLLSTVTDDEAIEHAAYFDRLPLHYVEHKPELDALEESRSGDGRDAACP